MRVGQAVRVSAEGANLLMETKTVLILNVATEEASSTTEALQQYDLNLIEHKADDLPPGIDNPWDLIVVDADGDGPLALESCARLRTEAIEPIVLLTHDQDEEFQLQAYGAGVDECIVKPIGSDLLYAKLTRWLRFSSAAD